MPSLWTTSQTGTMPRWSTEKATGWTNGSGKWYTSGKNKTSQWTEMRGPTNFHISMITHLWLLTVHHTDTWWTVVPTKAAAVAETSTITMNTKVVFWWICQLIKSNCYILWLVVWKNSGIFLWFYCILYCLCILCYWLLHLLGWWLIAIEGDYSGPKLDAEGKVTVEFTEQLMAAYKQQQKLHRRYAYQVDLHKKLESSHFLSAWLLTNYEEILMKFVKVFRFW